MPCRNAEVGSMRSLAALLLPALAISASLEEPRDGRLLTRYSRDATPANAFRRCYSKHQQAGGGGGRHLERGDDGTARTRRLRRAGDGASAGHLRRADRRLLRASGREARASDLSQVRPAWPAPAQPARGGEGQ